jgi:O-antigen ligase
MGFVLTLIYIALTLLSPAVLPEAIWSLHVADILGVLTILSILPSIPGAKLGSIPETYLGIGLLIATSASILATGWVGGAAQTLLNFSPILLVFYFVAITCRSLRRLKILTAVLMAVALFVFAQGAFAFYTGNFASRYLEPEGISGTLLYRFRGLGVISDPNDLAQVYVMLIPLLWLRWKRGRFASNFLFTLVPAGILVVAVYFTHSRGGFIALLAIILFGFKDKIGLVKSAIFVAIACVGLLALDISGGRGINDDDGGRVAAWATGLQIFKTHPIFGIGIDNFSDYNETGNTAHNSYVLCLAELGMFGYFFWMGMIVSGWSGMSKMIPSTGKKTLEFGSGEPDDRNALEDEPGTLAEPWLRTPELGRVAVETGAHATAFSHSALYASGSQYVETGSPYYPGPMDEDASTNALTEDDNLIYAAKILRVSFVGLLSAAFFISRTYSVTLYILLGMAVALRMVYLEKHPDSTMGVLSLLKRTWIVIFVSMILLYLFVRLHGVR